MTFILLPVSLCLLDIATLAVFDAATKQDNYGVAFFAKVRSVAGAKKET
jgi:hypothetical protein